MHFANRKGLPRALIISFCSGLCLCNQHTSVFYIIPIALWTMLSGGWALWRPRSLALLSVAALSYSIAKSFRNIADDHYEQRWPQTFL